MRKLYGLLSVVVVGGLVGICPAQEIIHYRDDICPTCGRDEKSHDLIVIPTTLMAHVGNFNLSCRGSYKFPVPPQYTYHWPGMYSQQSVSEYPSPWRVPPRMLLHGHLIQAVRPSSKFVRLARPPKSSVPARCSLAEWSPE